METRQAGALERILLLAALIVFVLATFGVNIAGIALVPLGLALFVGAHLV